MRGRQLGDGRHQFGLLDRFQSRLVGRQFQADSQAIWPNAGLGQSRGQVVPGSRALVAHHPHGGFEILSGRRPLDQRMVRRDKETDPIAANLLAAEQCLFDVAFDEGQVGLALQDHGGGLGGMIGAIAIAILAPIAAMLVQMAISRAREYEADRIGAEIGGDPAALARALEKIEAYARGGYENHAAERNPATAHMFIINPLNGKGADNLFSTHPATRNRVEALMRLGVGQGAARRSVVPVSEPAIRPNTGRNPGPWG